MDETTIALIISTLAGVWTAFQEWRHRKDKKAKMTDVFPNRKK